jgi:GAF domain-containing protein
MKRRSRAGGDASKARHRTARKTKRRSASRTASPSAPTRDAEIARLSCELNEAREQQAATSEVLRVIRSSPGDLQPVFETILENAVRICDAKFGNIFRWDGEAIHLLAAHNTPPALAEARRRSPPRATADAIVGRMVATKKLIHVADVATEPDYLEQRAPSFAAAVELGGIRTVLLVPMLKENELMGAFSVYRQEVRPFTEKQIALVENFAAQAVIAIENARLLNELRQSLEQQTATSEVLHVISSSPGDLQPVFDSLLRNATRLCRAKFGSLYLQEEGGLRLVAAHDMPAAFSNAHGKVAIDQAPGGVLEGAMRTKHPVQIADLAATEAYAQGHSRMVEAVELGGIRTAVGVPLLKEDEPIGVITIQRPEVVLFDEQQIALLKNFAAQAVIAIENARLLNELRQSLEQQTATADVLRVISSSPADLVPVFQAMLENATRICDAKFGNIYRAEGDGLRIVAAHNTPPVFAKARWSSPYFSPGPKNPVRRMMTTKAVVHVTDVAATEAYAEGEPAAVASFELGGTRTLVIVPMLKDNELVGAFTLARQEVRPFTDKQIELVKNFAAQAVIAIENARLLNELRQRTDDLSQRTTDLTEALEQQTATSDLLQVISGSPGNLEPVFQAMLENAVSICGANFGNMFLYEDDAFRTVAMFNAPEAYANARMGTPLHPPSDSGLGRLVATKEVVQIADLRAVERYVINRDPFVVAAVELAGIRTLLAVPMLKEGRLVGAIVIYRQEVRPFGEKQTELVKNFASQVVIAIENARLLNELRQRTDDLTEALDQQTATSEVLQVISSSPGELEPVFAAMLGSATRICEAELGNLFLREGETFRAVAWHGVENWHRGPLIIKTEVPEIPLARLVETKQRVHIADLRQEAAYKAGFAPLVALVDRGGARTLLIVPMLKESTLVGAIAIYRQEIRPFTAKQIALVENFAAQAVIAIENARLLRELRERTEDVVKLNEHLEQRVTDQVGEIERMGRLRRFLPPQVADLIVASGTEKQLESHRREITALFCDLRGFTGFSESADPEDVIALLRDYHAAIGEIIIKYSGTLERYAGDGVMVVFNDPVPVDNPALQAVLMALEMRGAIGALTEKWRRLGHDIGFGIGIAHGFATLGTIGFEGRFDYAAIGTVSNVASRLCDEAKPGQILISPRVLMAVEDAVTVEPVGEFALKGIRRPLAAYNVLAQAG